MSRVSLRDVIADRVRIMRELAGLTPDQVAERIAVRTDDNTSASYIRRVEKGLNSVSVEILANICIACGSTLGQFFSSLEESSKRTPREKEMMGNGK